MNTPDIPPVDPPVVPSSGWKRRLSRFGLGALTISVLVHACFILLAIFFFYAWVQPPADPPPDFGPVDGGGGGGDGGHKVMQRQKAQRAISSAVSHSIVSTAISDFTLPDAKAETLDGGIPQLSGGAGSGGGSQVGSGGDDGKGLGTGSGDGMGKGLGKGFGNVTFFNQKANGKRIAFVIDYSLSMQGRRIELLRAELQRSVAALSSQQEFQLIFFAGPAWLAGDRVEMSEDRREAVVHGNGKPYQWGIPDDRPVWEVRGTPRNVPWYKVDPIRIESTLAAIQETPMQYGTSWEGPLEMALKMSPVPDVIFFMTDGVSGSESTDIAKKMGHRAKTKKTIINAISMMEPKTVGPMKELARRTGGKFSVINQDGSVTEQDLSTSE